jgi:hypothetical protein
MKCIIIDNFFERFENIEKAFKEIPVYKKEEFNSKFQEKQNWPGKRSGYLNNENTFLLNLFLNEFYNKINIGIRGITLHTHLRLSSDLDKDWIHKDSFGGYIYTCIVYLSKTNLNSGTYIYSSNNEIISDVKFVQNRAFLFDTRYLHSTYGNHGEDINDGRLTLNAFITTP